MSTIVHTLAKCSDEAALASNSTLPHFVRFKSQSLRQYLCVSKDGKGTLTFSGTMDHMDPTIVFETVHVHALRNLIPDGRKGIKIKSLATNKYWKRVFNYNVPQSGKEGNGVNPFNIVMAVGDGDGDIFEFETEEMKKSGVESKKVTLWNPIDMRFLAPFSPSQSNFARNTLHYLGYMSKEKSWKESILIVEVVIGPRTIWPMGIIPESALAAHIVSNNIQIPKEPVDGDGLPSTIILTPQQKSSLQGLGKSEGSSIELCTNKTLLEDQTKVPNISTSNTDDPNKSKSYKEVRFAIGPDKQVSKTAEASKNRRSSNTILIDDSVQPQMLSKIPMAESKKKLTSTKEGKIAVGVDTEVGDVDLNAIALLTLSQTCSLTEAPRKLKPEEMAVLFSDCPDQGNEPDPGLENISQFQNQFINYMTVDWAKDWIYSQTGKDNDQIVPPSTSMLKSNPTSIARFEASSPNRRRPFINKGKGCWCYKIPDSLLDKDKNEKLSKGKNTV